MEDYHGNEPDEVTQELQKAAMEVLPPQKQELKIAIGTQGGAILVRFNREISSIKMSKKDAKEFANQLIKKAL